MARSATLLRSFQAATMSSDSLWFAGWRVLHSDRVAMVQVIHLSELLEFLSAWEVGDSPAVEIEMAF